MTNKKLIASTPMLLMASALCAQESAQEPMNILYIMSDDHSFQTISAYNGKLLDTPNIDRLAQDGVLFANSFVANSISGPSRACLFTGKHSHANGFLDNTSSVFDGSQQTMPKILQKAGYTTAVIGKWHLNSDPTGFDHSDILIGQGIYYNAPFILNGVQTKTHGYATEVTTDKGIEWLENGRDKNKPFCLFLHHKAPHRTWMPDLQDLDLFSDREFELPETFWDEYEGRTAAQKQEMSIFKDMDLVYDLKLADKENEIRSPLENHGRRMYDSMTPEQRAEWDAHYDPIIEEFKKAGLEGKELAKWKYQQYMRDYLSTVVSLDRNIGRVLDYLKETGLDKNTLVVYTSDQGFYMGEHGWFDKRFIYEESFRTPLLVRYPGGKQGVVKEFVQNIDHAPTILSAAGIEVPSDIHGESYLPLLKGEKVKNWRDAIYYHFYEYPAEHMVMRHYGVRDDRYKLVHFYSEGGQWELYDLKRDPSELNNIYGKKGSEKITAMMMEKLIALQKEYNDTAALEFNKK